DNVCVSSRVQLAINQGLSSGDWRALDCQGVEGFTRTGGQSVDDGSQSEAREVHDPRRDWGHRGSSGEGCTSDWRHRIVGVEGFSARVRDPRTGQVSWLEEREAADTLP